MAQACGRATLGEFRQDIIYAHGAAHEVRGLLQVARLLDHPPQYTDRYRSRSQGLTWDTYSSHSSSLASTNRS